MRKDGVDVENVWREIRKVIVTSLVAVNDEIPNQTNSFEVYGYDILIDKDLKPWLIEVNCSPSMSRDTHIDKKIKTQMIADTISIVNPLSFDREKLFEICQRRLEEVVLMM